MNREVGPYRRAVKDDHFPKTEERLKTLRHLLNCIQAFSGEEPGLEPEELEFQRGAQDLIARYEKKIVGVLREAKRKDEPGARNAVSQAKKACKKLTHEAFAKLKNSLNFLFTSKF